MIDINELREAIQTFGSQAINEGDLNELLDRLEAAEKERDALRAENVGSQPAPSIPEGWKLVPVEVVDLYSFMCSAFTHMTPQQGQIAIQLDLAKRAMLTSSLGLVDQAMTPTEVTNILRQFNVEIAGD